jgi:putative two-component system response regulator
MSRILVIDDEDVIRGLMAEILRASGHEVECAETAERALALLEDDDFDLDLVVSDVVMPGLSGLELVEAARARRASLPILLVTGAGTYDTLSEALTRGASGLVTKPFSHAELITAVGHALERASASRDDLRERLLAPTLASALANAIEARDSYLHGHCERLAALAVRIGEVLSLNADEMETLRLGAILHDVGKIGIPDRVLLKPGALDEEEWLIAKQHPLIGDKLLEPLDLLAGARPIVRHHHERWDGDGYPDRLAAEEIPLGARIVAVADSVEAMSSRQLYRKPRTTEEIVAELYRQRGAQWDSRVVDVVLRLLESGELVLAEEGLRLLEPAAGASNGSVAVLLVERDDAEAELLTNALQRAVEGIVVARAKTVAGACELAARANWALAVVDDGELPDGRSVEVVERLQGAEPAIPVVVLTSADAARAEDAHGAADCVVKGGSYLEALVGHARIHAA